MRHLNTFHQQINESKSPSNIVKTLLGKFSENVDTKGLTEYIMPHKNTLKPYYAKYVENGVINADLIHSDFSKFNFGAKNEAWGRDDDYADDSDNNPILRFLYKMFVRWPKSFVKGIWEFFYITVVESFKDGGIGIVMSAFGLIMWALTAILVFLLGMFIYQVTEHAINGLDKGKVKTEVQYEPNHYEDHVHTYMCGKTMMSYTTHDYVPDRWHVKVEGDDGRVEQWNTYNKGVAIHTKIGQEIINDDNWTWEATE